MKLTNKKQKFNDFIKNSYGVERLGQGPSYKVTLYNPPRIDATLALEDGAVKLSLASFGYEAVTTSKDHFMGFESSLEGFA